MPLRETASSGDAGKEGDRQSLQAENSKRKRETAEGEHSGGRTSPSSKRFCPRGNLTPEASGLPPALVAASRAAAAIFGEGQVAAQLSREEQGHDIPRKPEIPVAGHSQDTGTTHSYNVRETIEIETIHKLQFQYKRLNLDFLDFLRKYAKKELEIEDVIDGKYESSVEFKEKIEYSVNKLFNSKKSDKDETDETLKATLILKKAAHEYEDRLSVAKTIAQLFNDLDQNWRNNILEARKQTFADSLDSNMLLNLKHVFNHISSNTQITDDDRKYITRIVNEILIKREFYITGDSIGTRVINKHTSIPGNKDIPNLALDLYHKLDSLPNSILEPERKELRLRYISAGLDQPHLVSPEQPQPQASTSSDIPSFSRANEGKRPAESSPSQDTRDTPEARKQIFADGLDSNMLLNLRQELEDSSSKNSYDDRKYITRIVNEILIKREYYVTGSSIGTRIINKHIPIPGDKNIPNLAFDLYHKLDSLPNGVLETRRKELRSHYISVGLDQPHLVSPEQPQPQASTSSKDTKDTPEARKKIFADSLDSNMLLNLRKELKNSSSKNPHNDIKYMIRIVNEILIKREYYVKGSSTGTRIINEHILIPGDKDIPNLAFDLYHKLDSLPNGTLKTRRKELRSRYISAGLDQS